MDIWIPCCWDSCDIKPHLSFNRINCRCYSQDFNDSRIVASSKWCIASLLVSFHSNMRISIFFLGKINCFPNDTEIECRLMLIWTHKSIFTICVATRFYRFVINKREEKKTTMWLICSCSPIIIQIWSRREQKRCLMRSLETRCRAFHTTGHSNSHSDWFHLRCLLRPIRFRPIRFYTSTLSIVSFIYLQFDISQFNKYIS